MILIVGNSDHLHEAICLAYPDHEIKMISWRGLAHEAIQSQADLLFIVGFDYGSYMKRYEDYIDVNVMQPMLAVRRFAKPTASIVYVATQNERSNYTFSRYRYAKEKLGQELMHQSTKAYALRFDTFVTPNQEPLVKGGAITRLVFGTLRKLGVVKTMASVGAEPAVLGQMIAGALVGTFLGILLAYGFVSPLAQLAQQKVGEASKELECVKATLLAAVQGYSPQVALEFGRKVMNASERPSFAELEEHVKGRKR